MNYLLTASARVERGYDSKWRKTRKAYLAKHPLCVYCSKEGRTEQATVLDHIIPHKGCKKLFWDRNNWQGLCGEHHNSQKRREENRHNQTLQDCIGIQDALQSIKKNKTLVCQGKGRNGLEGLREGDISLWHNVQQIFCFVSYINMWLRIASLKDYQEMTFTSSN